MIETRRRATKTRYEFRVWGGTRELSDQLSQLADAERDETLSDCYLLLGDQHRNAKIRKRKLKVKRLEEVRFGFQRWSSSWYRLDIDTPEKIDELVAGLRRGRTRRWRSQRRLAGMVDGLGAPEAVRPVLVTKLRRRFQLDSLRAEATMIEVVGQPGRLNTVAIEGTDLDDLVRLRASLGLDHLPNVALHVAVDPAYNLSARARATAPSQIDRSSGAQSSVSTEPPSR